MEKLINGLERKSKLKGKKESKVQERTFLFSSLRLTKGGDGTG